MKRLSVPTRRPRPLLCIEIVNGMPLGVFLFTKSVYFFRMSSGIHVGHQAHGNLRRSLRRDHRLCAGATKPPGMPWTSSVGRAHVR